jgi:hypothetical protein
MTHVGARRFLMPEIFEETYAARGSRMADYLLYDTASTWEILRLMAAVLPWPFLHVLFSLLTLKKVAAHVDAQMARDRRLFLANLALISNRLAV